MRKIAFAILAFAVSSSALANGVVPTVPTTLGGTGATTASGARTNLGAAASGANSDITSLSGLSTPLATTSGGTGGTTGVGGTSFVDQNGGLSRSDASRWGDTVYATNYAALSAAILAAASKGAALIFPQGSYDVSGLIFSVPVIVQPGASLGCSTGQATFNETIIADRYQIFANGCTPAFSTGSQGGGKAVVYPEWWGAVASFSTRSTAAFKAALNTGYAVDVGPNPYVVCGLEIPFNGVLKGHGIPSKIFIDSNCANFFAPAPVQSYAIAGGAGYTQGDIVTVVGGTVASGYTATQMTLTSVTAGVPVLASLTNMGVYTAAPSGTLSVTGGTGSGLTITNLAYDSLGIFNASLNNNVFDLEDFQIVGGAQSGVVDVLRLDATGGNGPAPGPYLHNLFFSGGSGTCLTVGNKLNGANVSDLNLYNCGQYGIVSLSDDTHWGGAIDVGQSGYNGIYISNGGSQTWGAGLKVWFSGHSTAPYAGVLCNQCQGLTMSSLFTQDNGGNGFDAEGSGSSYASDLNISGLFDSDNGSNNGSASVHCFKCANSIFNIVTKHRTGGAGNPSSAFQPASVPAGQGNIVNVVDSASNNPVLGDWTNNTVSIGGLSYANTVSYAATYSPGVPAVGNQVNMTLTGNISISAPTSFSGANPVGFSFCLKLTQDATGGRTIAWNSIYKISGTVVTTANTATRACFVYDGTFWQQNSFTSGL